MNEIWAFSLGLLPSIITGIATFYLQRAQKKRDKHLEKRANARKQESLLSLGLMMASAKLSYACAVALQVGHVTNEVQEAKEAYEKAESAYYRFMKEQTTEHIQG